MKTCFIIYFLLGFLTTMFIILHRMAVGFSSVLKFNRYVLLAEYNILICGNNTKVPQFIGLYFTNLKLVQTGGSSNPYQNGLQFYK